MKDKVINDLESLLRISPKNESDYQNVERYLNNNNKIDLNQYISTGHTPLSFSIDINDERLFDLLLQYKSIDLDKKTDLGWSPLHLAVKNKNTKIKNKLLAKGANRSITYNRLTPEEYVFASQIMERHLMSYSDVLQLPFLLQIKIIAGFFYFISTSSLNRFMYPIHPQFWILSKMNKLDINHTINMTKIGACFGVSHVSTLMMITNKRDDIGNHLGLKKLKMLFTRMKLMSIEAFQQIGHLEQEKVELFHLIKKRVSEMGEQDIDACYAQHQFLNNKPKRQIVLEQVFEEEMQSHFSNAKRLDLEMKLYMQAIDLFQNIHEHKELQHPYNEITHQDSNLIFPLLASEELNMQGGIVELANHFNLFMINDKHHQNELILYFQHLRSIFNHSNQVTSVELLSFQPTPHAISIHYDPQSNEWTFICANHIGQSELGEEIIVTNSEEKIAQLIVRSFNNSSFEFIALSAKIYTTGNSAETLLNEMNSNKSLTYFKQIFDITPQKKKLLNSEIVSHVLMSGAIEFINELYRIKYFNLFEYAMHAGKALYFKFDQSNYFIDMKHERINTRDTFLWISVGIEDLLKEKKYLFNFHKNNVTIKSRLNFWSEFIKELCLSYDAADFKNISLYQLILEQYVKWIYLGLHTDELFTHMQLGGIQNVMRGLSNHIIQSFLTKNWNLKNKSSNEIVSITLSNFTQNIQKIYAIDSKLYQKTLNILLELKEQTDITTSEDKMLKQQFLRNVCRISITLSTKNALIDQIMGSFEQAVNLVYDNYSEDKKTQLAEFKESLLCPSTIPSVIVSIDNTVQTKNF